MTEMIVTEDQQTWRDCDSVPVAISVCMKRAIAAENASYRAPAMHKYLIPATANRTNSTKKPQTKPAS